MGICRVPQKKENEVRERELLEFWVLGSRDDLGKHWSDGVNARVAGTGRDLCL